jgi:hypothetical protein
LILVEEIVGDSGVEESIDVQILLNQLICSLIVLAPGGFGQLLRETEARNWWRH